MVNWLDKQSSDYTFGMDSLKAKFISSNSTVESSSKSALNAKVTLTDNKAEIEAAVAGDKIVKISATELTSLKKKWAVMDAMIDAQEVYIAACAAYKKGLET